MTVEGEGQFRDDVIADLGGLGLRLERSVGLLDAFDGVVDVGVGEFAGQFVELEALPVRDFEGGTNFDVEFPREISRFGKKESFGLELGFANRGDLFIFGDLRERIEDERALDAFNDFLLEALFDHLARSFTSAEAGDRLLFLEFGVFAVEIEIDVGAGDLDGDVTFASAFFFDVSFKSQFTNFVRVKFVFHSSKNPND